jgi:hypothetical protein
VNNLVPKSEDLQQLEIVSAELTTASNQTLPFCSCYLYKNLVVSGDFSLPSISWEEIGNITGANELAIVELLNDHFLSQLNTTPTRGGNVLDLVITSVPELVSVTEIMSPDKTAVFTDHSTILYGTSFPILSKLRQRLKYLFMITIKELFAGLRAALRDKN